MEGGSCAEGDFMTGAGEGILGEEEGYAVGNVVGEAVGICAPQTMTS
jgi:hypothetical protein